ncbi:MAG: hypothetical protein R3276_06675 [Marinobacter sp.]|nr:hypothetical protein [Marinobacter sp.]
MTDEDRTYQGNPALPGGLIPLAEWRLPAASVQHTLKDGLRSAWGRLRQGVRTDEIGINTGAEITSVSQLQLRRLAPDPDWSVRAKALAVALDELNTTQATNFLVAPPFSGLRQPLLCLAEQRQWQVIAPPGNLLMGQEEAVAWWDALPLDRPWVIPDLAKFWLRHYAGLSLVRALFNRVISGQCAPGVVGCSSWCWSFWYRYLDDLSVSAFTPAPMMAEDLSLWLDRLPDGSLKSPLRVRKSNNGYWVLPIKEQQDTNGSRHSTYLKDLSALARGNPGVALAIWQRALRVKPDEPQPEAEANSGESKDAGTRDCWVVPLDQVSLPSLSSISQPAIQLLHGMLLHDGLDSKRLSLVTGLPDLEVQGALRILQRHDLVERCEDDWQVTPQGYPWIRRQLQSEGYPVDGF